jgi:hypothetical protein
VSFCIKRDFFSLSKRQSANEVSALAGGDQFTTTCTATLLSALVTKEVTVPWRATQEFTGACLLEAFGDGFTCFLHEKVGKDGENTAFGGACKG